MILYFICNIDKISLKPLRKIPLGVLRIICAQPLDSLRDDGAGSSVTGKVIHASFERECNPPALIKGVIPLPRFQLGIIALINAGEHLHFDLCIAPSFPKCF